MLLYGKRKEGGGKKEKILGEMLEKHGIQV